MIDRALEALLRARLPLPDDVGDVSFDVPDREWGARLSRVTVNVYLFDVAPSARPPGPADKRVRPDGRVEVRAQLPVVRLGYLVSAWAGTTRDEHELLSEVLTTVVSHQTIPEEHLPASSHGAVQLALAQRDGRQPGDLWSGLDGRMKPALEVEVTVPLGPQPWLVAAPSVERIAALVAPRPAPTPAPRPAPVPDAPTSVRRLPDGRLERVVIAVDRPVRE
ncbi:MAG TPA: DUF4255 domain-containing protein [Frankiaceae bacterium]|nr:DUF4255 domain-containing protein [Frankiaceae bacterium]